MSEASGILLRAYDARDEDASVALWLRTWTAAYPAIDFAERLDWWRARWRNELLPAAKVVIAEAASATDGTMIGFVTVDPQTLYLDQIVVAPERWGVGIGAALIAEAKRISPRGLDLDVNTDNARAIRLLRQRGLRHHRRRQKSDHRPAGSPHELAAVTDQAPSNCSFASRA